MQIKIEISKEDLINILYQHLDNEYNFSELEKPSIRFFKGNVDFEIENLILCFKAEDRRKK